MKKNVIVTILIVIIFILGVALGVVCMFLYNVNKDKDNTNQLINNVGGQQKQEVNNNIVKDNIIENKNENTGLNSSNINVKGKIMMSYQIIGERDKYNFNELKNKYNGEYIVYANGVKLGKYHGSVQEDGWLNNNYSFSIDDNLPFHNDFPFAIAVPIELESYNPFPRSIKFIYGQNLSDNYDNILNEAEANVKKDYNEDFCIPNEMISVDLDGNGKDEYIIAFDSANQGQLSLLCLFDNNLNIVSYMTIADRRGNEAADRYSNLEKFYGQVADIDGDGTMEILVSQPVYEGDIIVDTFKYKNGSLIEGEFKNYYSATP